MDQNLWPPFDLEVPSFLFLSLVLNSTWLPLYAMLEFLFPPERWLVGHLNDVDLVDAPCTSQPFWLYADFGGGVPPEKKGETKHTQNRDKTTKKNGGCRRLVGGSQLALGRPPGPWETAGGRGCGQQGAGLGGAAGLGAGTWGSMDPVVRRFGGFLFWIFWEVPRNGVKNYQSQLLILGLTLGLIRQK